MLEAEPLRMFPFGQDCKQWMPLQGCDVPGMSSVAGGGALAPLSERRGCAEGVLGDSSSDSGALHPASRLSTCSTACSSLFLYCLNQVIVKVHRLTGPGGEFAFSVSVV